MPDTALLARRYAAHLRVSDVCDALDVVGRADLMLMDPAVRPLWRGLRFWGHATTMRLVPSNVRVPPLAAGETYDQTEVHRRWGHEAIGGIERRYGPLRPRHVTPGCVIVAAAAGVSPNAAWYGSEGLMSLVEASGAAGVVTDGACRDTDEVILQRSPIACAAIGRAQVPGRAVLAGVDEPVSCGGVLVHPGDIVGCDGDGVVVVPADLAEDVLRHAAAIAVHDKRWRASLYEKLGRAKDDTVDWEAAERDYEDLL